MEFNEILERIGISRKFCEGVYAAECPSCHGTDKLLIRFDDEEGKTVFRCDEGCTRGQICAAIDIKENDLYAESHAPYSICFKSLDDFEEQDAKWLFKNWLPEGQITLLAADGGVGKTTIWCNLAAAVSNGNQSILDDEDTIREPKTVLIFTTEDSISQKLKKKLRLAGANMKNIKALDLQQDKDGKALSALVFGSADLNAVIRQFRPALCIFDPVQGFLSPDINMGSRNAMRTALAPLISLGEECGTTFLIICHSNKRKGAAGRDRIADSADLWDISRSVLMAGYTQEQGIRYLSNEKNNYAMLPQTILFSINDEGLAEKRGTTHKRDRDYMVEAAQTKAASNTAPQRDDCRQFILETLQACEGNKIASSELLQVAKDEGYSKSTFQRTKDDMREHNEIIVKREGGTGRGGGTWYTYLGEIWAELPKWEQTPFDLQELE